MDSLWNLVGTNLGEWGLMRAGPVREHLRSALAERPLLALLVPELRREPVEAREPALLDGRRARREDRGELRHVHVLQRYLVASFARGNTSLCHPQRQKERKVLYVPSGRTNKLSRAKWPK